MHLISNYDSLLPEKTVNYVPKWEILWTWNNSEIYAFPICEKSYTYQRWDLFINKIKHDSKTFIEPDKFDLFSMYSLKT